jgi:hypothetical protein
VAPGDQPEDLGSRLERLGLPSQESEMAMAMSAALVAGFSTSRWRDGVPGLRIERLTTPDLLASFARINAENWDPPIAEHKPADL